MKAAGWINHQVDLAATAEHAFWTLLTAARDGGIDSSFEYWEPREWPPVVGTHTDFKTRVGGLSMKGVSRFALFDPPHRLLIESVTPKWPMFLTMSWDLVPNGSGTRFDYRMDVSAVTGMGWVARSMLRRYDRQLALDVPALANLF